MRLGAAFCRAAQHVDQRPGSLRQANNHFTRLLRFFLVWLRCSGGCAQRGINSRLQTACRRQHLGLCNHATSAAFLADDVQKLPCMPKPSLDGARTSSVACSQSLTPSRFSRSGSSRDSSLGSIVGLPNVGKSTLFNALTKSGIAAENYPFCTIEPNVGIVEVPDKRMAQLAEIVKPQRMQYAIVEFVDIAGLVAGASKGEGLGNQFLANIRETDAVVHVVRCFADDNVIHVSGGVDPIRDIEVIDTELALASGRMSATSSNPTGLIQACACITLEAIFACVSIAPFDTPVVPPVYCRKAMSS